MAKGFVKKMEGVHLFRLFMFGEMFRHLSHGRHRKHQKHQRKVKVTVEVKTKAEVKAEAKTGRKSITLSLFVPYTTGSVAGALPKTKGKKP